MVILALYHTESHTHSVGLLWTRDRPVATHKTDKGQTSMPPARFEPAILASDRPQTLALDRSATGIGKQVVKVLVFSVPILTKYEFVSRF